MRYRAGAPVPAGDQTSLTASTDAGSPFVDLTAMSERDHDDEQDIMVDGVEDAVVAHPDPEARSATERAGGGRTWILGQQGDRPLDPTSGRWVDLAQSAGRGRA
jgi:hypothetical protein